MAKAAVKPKEAIVDFDAIKKEVADNPIILFMDASKLIAYVAALRDEVENNPGDVGTVKGRDIIKSNAAEIGRKKTAIDKERLRKTEEWRSMTATVNAAGKAVKEALQALQDETRAPLTAWEEREEARRSEAEEIIADMKTSIVVQVGDTADALRERLDRIRSRNLSDEMFGPRIEEVTDLRDEAVAALQAAIARVEQEEADRAELTRLREEREQRARDDAARLEQEEREKAEAEQQRLNEEAEIQRQAEAAARIEQERQDAADAAAREVEQRAQAERDRLEEVQRAIEAKRTYARQIIEHIREVGQGRIGGATYPYPILLRELTDKIVINDDMGDMQGEVRAVLDATLVAVQAAFERAQERAAREAREEEERKVEEERRAREDNRAHRSAIQREVKEAIMSCGADEETAKKIVLAILAKTVPHTTIAF